MSFTRFGNHIGTAAARKEQIELHYAFDFDAHETVIYTGAGPFPGRVFALRFWRHAKDGIMQMLGYVKTGTWIDPTVCHPDSHVRYHRHQRPLAHPPHTQPGDVAGHEQPQDTMQRRPRPAAPLEQMAYRVPLLELDHGVWELPTLKGKTVHHIGHAMVFPHKSLSLPHITKLAVAKAPIPPLGTPIDRTLEFVRMSAHFEHPSQADRELAKVVKVLKQFPRLQITIQGNFQPGPGYVVRGYGPYPRHVQARPYPSPFVTKWPDEVESYTTIGQVMDSRARTIQQYIINHGINARRVHTSRGQFEHKRTFTIIFSN